MAHALHQQLRARQVKQLLLDGSTASRAQLLTFLPSLLLQSLCVVRIDTAGKASLTQAFKEGCPSLVKLTCASTYYLPEHFQPAWHSAFQGTPPV